MGGVSAKQRHPWDRLKGEPTATYARFLSYRNLGPLRTLAGAYRAHGGAPKGTERSEAAEAPGSWRRECLKYGWAERAAAWDVANLRRDGREAAVAFVSAIRRLGLKALEAMARDDVAPQSWADVLETMDRLNALISPEAIEALSADPEEPGPARPERPPTLPIGGAGGNAPAPGGVDGGRRAAT